MWGGPKKNLHAVLAKIRPPHLQIRGDALAPYHASKAVLALYDVILTRGKTIKSSPLSDTFDINIDILTFPHKYFQINIKYRHTYCLKFLTVGKLINSAGRKCIKAVKILYLRTGRGPEGGGGGGCIL